MTSEANGLPCLLKVGGSVTIHLLRHGDTGQEGPRRFLGQRDVPLSDLGREQAGLWRQALAGVAYAAAYASSLSRCQETAAIVLQGREVQARPVDGLREVNLGGWDGLSVAQVKAAYPGQYEARGRDMAGFRPEGGESFQDVADRAGPALEAIVEAHGGERHAHVLVVAHAGVNRAILCRFLCMPLGRLFSLGQDHACLNVIGFAGPVPLVRALNLPPPGYSSPYSNILR